VRKSQVKISVRHVAILYESTRTVTAVTLVQAKTTNNVR
jgi:hypothetical protein